MADLIALVAQYPVLGCLASFLSTVDLFNLALTNKAHRSYILPSRRVFDILRRDCLCDGSGLVKRQNFEGLYSLRHRGYNWGNTRHICKLSCAPRKRFATKAAPSLLSLLLPLGCPGTGSNVCVGQDEPIEVRLYGTKCDEAEALPCRKCSINICEVSLKPVHNEQVYDAEPRPRNADTIRANRHTRVILRAVRISTALGRMKTSSAFVPSATPKQKPKKSGASSSASFAIVTSTRAGSATNASRKNGSLPATITRRIRPMNGVTGIMISWS